MANTFKVKFYADPGHGWGAVKRKVLVDLGILDRISHYSYQKGSTVYLEEDCDFPLFATTLNAKLNGVIFEYAEKSTNSRSPIRSYDSFKA
jgi:hypothetical protein